MLYAVCTKCPFMRAYSRSAAGATAPEACPSCGSELYVASGEARFPSTYVGRVSIELLGSPELDDGQPQRQTA